VAAEWRTRSWPRVNEVRPRVGTGTAYDDKDEPLLNDEEGGEGALIGRFVRLQRAGHFAARCAATSASRAACLKVYISISLMHCIIPSRR
jgi:hypothetical protein